MIPFELLLCTMKLGVIELLKKTIALPKTDLPYLSVKKEMKCSKIENVSANL